MAKALTKMHPYPMPPYPTCPNTLKCTLKQKEAIKEKKI